MREGARLKAQGSRRKAQVRVKDENKKG